MKTIFILLFVVFSSYSQIINFPDPNLKAKLLQSSPSIDIGGIGNYLNGTQQYVKIDTNNDGEIDQSEALPITSLAVHFGSISDLTGLEYFVNVQRLVISNNNITSFYFPNLVHLDLLVATNNPLTTLNLTGLTSLYRVLCFNNQLTALDFSGLPNLKEVYCGHNQLSSLDFSGNPLFEDLGCEYNPNLTTIKIKNNHTQLYGSQTHYNECWGGNPNLNYICADAAEIPALQSFLASCNMTQAITIDSACVLGVEGFNANATVFFDNLNVTPNPASNSFSINIKDTIYTNSLEIEIYNLIGQKIFENKNYKLEESIAIENWSVGTYLVKIHRDSQEIVKRLIKN